jgi:hypothetical protein
MMHQYKIQTPKLAVDACDELVDLPLEFGQVGHRGGGDLRADQYIGLKERQRARGVEGKGRRGGEEEVERRENKWRRG